jgi:hypothetical protein
MRKRRLAAAAVIPMILGLTLAACGAESDKPGVATANGGAGSGATASPSPVDREEARRKFAQCMREHGVDMPDPEPGGRIKLNTTGVDKKVLADATQACQTLLPNGGELSNLSPDQLEQVRKFAQCMREHGIDMPDPDPDGSLAKIIIGGDIDVNSQAFKDASAACRVFRPGASPSAGAAK